MYSEERKAEILTLISQRGSIDVNMLAEMFKTSRETIRRDLTDLERKGALKRTHGGAVALSDSPAINRALAGQMAAQADYPPESPIGERGVRQAEEKKRICQEAAKHIRPGDIIFIDNSSTMIYLPHYLPTGMDVTIITNSVGFLVEAAKIQGNHNWLLICLGGVFKSSNLSVHGSDTLKNAEPYYPSKTFTSCASVSAQNRIADASMHEIEIKRMMIERAQEVYLLADHTKFEKAGQIYLCNVDEVDTIITDSEFAMPEGLEPLLEKSGIRLIIV